MTLRDACAFLPPRSPTRPCTAGAVGCWWLVKSDVREPLLYAAILVLLLGWQLWTRMRKAPALGAATT